MLVTESESMWLATSFCLAVFLCSALDTQCSPLQTNSKDVYSDVFNVVTNDPGEIGTEKIGRKNPVNIVFSNVRRKRNYDYSDYYYSGSSSEEGNGYAYIPKPVYHHGFGHYWKLHRPVTQSGYGFWPSQPHQHNRQHKKNCKFPTESSGEYDGNYSGERSGPIGTTTLPNIPPQNPKTIRPPSLPITPPPTETVPTTTTEYIPVIDIRSSN